MGFKHTDLKRVSDVLGLAHTYIWCICFCHHALALIPVCKKEESVSFDSINTSLCILCKIVIFFRVVFSMGGASVCVQWSIERIANKISRIMRENPKQYDSACLQHKLCRSHCELAFLFAGHVCCSYFCFVRSWGVVLWSERFHLLMKIEAQVPHPNFGENSHECDCVACFYVAIAAQWFLNGFW